MLAENEPRSERRLNQTSERLGSAAQELAEDLTFRPIPSDQDDEVTWRLRFDSLTDPNRRFGLDIAGEVILGRDIETDNLVDLSPYGAGDEGVSRQHALLRPTSTNLFVIDLGSTNGTLRNGHSIGVNTPYPLVNGDVLTLGGLQLVIYIIDRPRLQAKTARLEPKLDLAAALSQIAKAITSQLDVDEVLNQVAETAMLLTAAGETGIWLVHEQTGELFLEAERGIKDEKIRRMRLPIRDDNLAGKVIKSGKPLRASHKPGEDQIKVKTDYLVEALVYVPIKLGGVTLGVLSAVHREAGKQFTRRDERLLEAIADFAAIAIQNARLYQATDEALARRVKELTALNEVSHAVSASLDLSQVYDVLVEQVNKNWPVETVRLYLYNRHETGLVPFHNHHEDRETRPLINRGILWRVAQSQQEIITNDVHNHPYYEKEVDGLGEDHPDSMACVPLTVQEQVVGVLALFNKASGSFTEEDMDRLKVFANPVAAAIENARLFEESERQRAAIKATAQTLSQPLIILDDNGEVLVANEAAQEILDNHMSQLFDGISRGVGRSIEVTIGEDKTYLSTVEHLSRVGTIIVMQDITYVKQLEQARAEFLHALSHDLKSPLTSIAGYAQLLEKIVPEDERSDRYLAQIVAASDRMLDMINQLLQVARGDAVKAVMAPCNLMEVAEQTLNDVEGAALNKSIRLRLEQTGEPYLIEGDESRLYHMLLNLVDNAIKYSPKETAVTIRAAFKGNGLTLQVADDGPGIPEKDLGRVFDKYYRGTQAKRQPGAGLGLSVVWAIVEAHEGRVTVRNAEEGGAVFTIEFPASLRVSAEAEDD